MPSISRIRFTNVIYENGNKRYNDDTFQFDGHNGAIILENGGGKTVFVQTAIQAVLPHAEIAGRKIKDTLMLENSAAHIGIEWIINERPRKYALTCVTLFMNRGFVDSYRYVYEYDEGDDNSIDKVPFVMKSADGNDRPATKEEIEDYYITMSKNRISAHTFSKIKDYHEYIENNFKIIPSEWRKIALINGAEGGVEEFFNSCKTTGQLVDNLLIPVVEDALSGNGTHDFAEMFEKQREHFKKYKELKSRIDESRLIESHIGSYVDVFEDYNKVNREYINEKVKTKAIYNFAVDEGCNNETKLIENEENGKKLEERENYLKKEQLSYNLALLQKDLEDLKKQFEIAESKFYELNSINEEKKKKLFNLKIANYKNQIREKEERVKYLKESIEKLDEDEDIKDIKEKLEVNTKELRGFYADHEDKLNKKIQVVDGQIRSYESEYEDYKNRIKNIEKEKSDFESGKQVALNTIKIMTDQMNKIAGQILANPSNENIEEENKKWQTRCSDIEKISYDCTQKEHEIENEKGKINSELGKLREEKNKLTNMNTLLTEKLNKQSEEEEKIKNRLKEAEISYGNIDSLYLKQQGIINGLETKFERLKDEKEKLILKERMACRFLDDYRENEYYTADPILEKLIDNFKTSFSYIESGTSYVERIARDTGKTVKDLYDIYPFWAVSVIVPDADGQRILDRMKSNRSSITHPVFILTVNEVTRKVNKKSFENNYMVFPELWESTLEKSNFKSLKNDMKKAAGKAVDERKEKENELNFQGSILKDVREFYDNYPYDDYLAIQKENEETESNIESTNKSINEKENRVYNIETEIKKYQKMIREIQEERHSLEIKIGKAKEYSLKNSEKLKNEAEARRLDEDLQKNQNRFTNYDNKRENLKKVIDDVKDEKEELKSSLFELIGRELYKEVKNVLPKYNDKGEELLKQERKDLKNKLDKKQKGRQDLEENITSDTKTLERLKRELNSLKDEEEYEVDEKFDFPINGLDEIQRLSNDISKMKKPIKTLENKKDELRDKYNIANGKYQSNKQGFYEEYDGIVSFTESFEEVKAKIDKEKSEINKQKDYLEQRQNKLIKQKNDIDDALLELKTQNGRYIFLADDIENVSLDDDAKENFSYNRKISIHDIMSELNNLFNELEGQRKKVETKKQEFIKFCETNINDVKLKHMAASGVEYRSEYEEIKEWQKSMSGRIQKIIEIFEGQMREHDKQLQQFINYLHSYISSITEELKAIPKKTRIKVDDSWKEVFTFNVPEWNEKEGKEKLIKHVDWMLSQLEDDRFKDESGNENDGEVRKAIEKWLSSKQLLQCVMNENTIKVKCRKVTNDGKVNSIPYSWEESNRWSGGEKWSKNMTLFLGILNYTAEKRKQIASGYARHRTVILDNPFGKASSDHVLDPVFFIANQLGFQIIALTALAEGKFIRTYFPIVYSCRLKNAENSDVQIMTKDMEVRKAFFRDNDFQTLIRLGETHQVSLFDQKS